ncbi:MAG: HAD-IB family phosphatase [Bacteroidaceae bacterium]|nr:HAD-IB family phosphatase [Bacteroidaceae bacterium]
MKNSKTVCAFDFDGTLTTKDTLLEFIRYAKGNLSFVVGFSLFTPLFILMKLNVMPNWKVKQWLFSWYFKGMRLDDFNDVCKRFALDKSSLLRPCGMQCVTKAIDTGAAVVIVSASIDNWVTPFFKGLPVAVCGTSVEVADGRLTGRFSSPNCYGEEKVRRLLALHPDRTSYGLIAYGDSDGDKALLSFADEVYYKPFRSC